MKSDTQITASRNRLWVGWALSAIAVMFLLFDGITKVIRLDPVVEATVQLGYPANIVSIIGIILVICTVLYLVPRTSVLGAVLLTGYLGGAVATHMRIESPLFSHVLFPVYFGALLWTGLLLRDNFMRELFPVRKRMEK